MNILLLSINYFPEKVGIGKYNSEFCEEAINLGNELSIVTAPPYYPEWSIYKGFKNKFNYDLLDGVNVYRCPIFVPKRLNFLKRIIHLVSFSFTSGFRLFTLLFKKYDVLICVQPTLFTAPFVLIFCKIKGVKSVMHIQDFEVDAMFGLSKRNSKLLYKISVFIETFIYRRFDLVSSISIKMLEKLKSKNVENESLVYFPNWADTDFITPFANKSQFLQIHDISPSKKLVLYSGNIGEKQGLENILYVANEIDNDDLLFVIVGEGANKSSLVKLSKDLCLTNVLFLPLQDWEVVPSMLVAASVHLVIQKKGAADAVMPSKLTNILSCGGHAVVTSEQNTELGMISSQFPGIYTVCQPECVQSLKSAILEVLCTSDSGYNIVARSFAEKHINKSTVISNFIKDLS